MRKLLTTTSLALLMAGTGFNALAQQNASGNAESGAVGAVICDGRFAAVDVDGNGFVTREEATRGIQQDFGAIDADGNGEITKTEYVDCKAHTRDQQAAEVARDAESFAAADVNKDQGVDRTEYMQAAQSAYEGGSGTDGAEPSSRYLWLTPDELKAGAAKDLPAGEAGIRSAMSFDRLDGNSDGILDTQEWEKAVPGGGNAGGAATARFENMDADQSGSLSKNEFSQGRSAMIDEMQTGSVAGTTSSANAQTSASTGQTSASTGGNANASASQGDPAQSGGIPVFVYHFLTY